MGKINTLIEKGENFRSGINKENFEGFSQWVADCSLYLEKKHKGLGFTKEFIKHSSSIVDIYLSEEIFLEENFKYVMGSLEGVKQYEKDYAQSLNNFFENIKKY